MRLSRPGFMRDLLIAALILLFGGGILYAPVGWLYEQMTGNSTTPQRLQSLLLIIWVALVCGFFGVYDEKVRLRQEREQRAREMSENSAARH